MEKVYKDQLLTSDKNGTHHILPIQKAKDYDVYSTHKIPISKGDEIRVSKNSFDKKGERLNNGTTLTVKGFDRYGNIKTEKLSKNKKRKFLLDKDFGNFDHCYCMTSYSSQGKTVDSLLISQPSATFAASNEKQFYVSVSRARENVTIYTDSKEDLLSSIHKSGDRQGATELLTQQDFKRVAVDIDIEPKVSPSKTKSKEYEPEL